MLKLNKEMLHNLYMTDLRTKYPTFPEHALPNRSYSDTTANGLTKCIIEFLNLSGHQAERISSMGRTIDKSKVVEDVLGRKRTIGSTQYIKGTSTNGTADISSVINGHSVKIEVKIGKDRQSADQKKYQSNVEKAGGIYWIAKDFDGFVELYRDFMHKDKPCHTSDKGVKFVVINKQLRQIQRIDNLLIYTLNEKQFEKYI